MEKIFSVPLKGGAITDVYISSLPEIEGELSSYQSALAIFDDNSLSSYGERPSVPFISIVPGEERKNWESVDQILSHAMGEGLARDSMFIGIGGGVVLDMTAFAASVYMRGARCILIPTTLLSAVDATLGGKTGIDYGGAKNAVGTFFPAEKVIISTAFLRTLPECEYRSGLGEVLKHALLSPDDELMRFLLSKRDKVLSCDPETVSEMIRLSLAVKISYITRDPEERKGIRSSLNLGHTFGHAVEKCAGYGNVLHGEAVSQGIVMCMMYSRRLGLISDAEIGRVESLLEKNSLPIRPSCPLDAAAMLDSMFHDKKTRSGKLRLVLLRGIGKAFEQDGDPDLARKTIDEFIGR